MKNVSLYYLIGLSSCVSTKLGVTTIIIHCCCSVLFSVTHTLLCVATKWGVTTIIIYIVVIVLLSFSFCILCSTLRVFYMCVLGTI